MTDAQLHPEFARRYREAWAAWCANPKLEDACRVVGLSDLDWAKRYVEAAYGPLTFSASSTSPDWIFDAALAWTEAKRQAEDRG